MLECEIKEPYYSNEEKRFLAKEIKELGKKFQSHQRKARKAAASLGTGFHIVPNSQITPFFSLLKKSIGDNSHRWGAMSKYDGASILGREPIRQAPIIQYRPDLQGPNCNHYSGHVDRDPLAGPHSGPPCDTTVGGLGTNQKGQWQIWRRHIEFTREQDCSTREEVKPQQSGSLEFSRSSKISLGNFRRRSTLEWRQVDKSRRGGSTTSDSDRDEEDNATSMPPCLEQGGHTRHMGLGKMSVGSTREAGGTSQIGTYHRRLESIALARENYSRPTRPTTSPDHLATERLR